MNKQWWKQHLHIIVICVAITITVLCLILGLIMLDSFKVVEGNGFSLIKQYGFLVILTKGVAQLQAGLVFSVILTPLLFIITIGLASYFYWYQPIKKPKRGR